MLKMRSGVAMLGLLLCAPWGALADEQAPASQASDTRARARELFLKGKRHYLERDYEAAMAAFGAAAKLHASPLLDFNMARCLDELGRREAAIEHYEGYLTARPDAQNSAYVRERVAALKRAGEEEAKRDPYEDLELPSSAPASAPTAVPAATGRTATPPSAPARAERAPAPARMSRPAPAPGRPGPWGQRPRESGPVYKQWWFWAAVVGGAVIGGFIIAMAASSGGDSDAARGQGGLTLEF